ncbi:glycoside hydrolase family 73 protein [Lactococcus nasutitermitis]|uniref:Glycoside hydrolase family 73 protein n=1 Tax=Lactococcus nasutitermitis TaxID=1652957 RepID=A0ABV9JCJ8_9LACT|nr:glycoside hydrolase family 73 protein [Lactococcus nasutitermitis]
MKKQVKQKKSHHLLSLFSKLVIVLLVFCGFNLNILNANEAVSQHELSTQLQTMIRYNFIRTVAPLAQKAQKEEHVLSSLTIAQACLESDFGQSLLASKYHNLFGVKSYGDVPTIKLNTQEYENNQWITIQGSFRVYQNFEASVLGHTRLFTKGTTWNPKQYASVLAAKNYKTAAHAVQSSGYATDPDYANKLISLIETYHLNKYDTM